MGCTFARAKMVNASFLPESFMFRAELAEARTSEFFFNCFDEGFVVEHVKGDVFVVTVQL